MKQQRGRQRRAGQNYERTDRVGGLIREIVATELERIDDERLFLLAVTGVDVDRELTRATVWFDVLDEEDVPEVVVALEEHRQRVQQTRARRCDGGHRVYGAARLELRDLFSGPIRDSDFR